MEEIRCLRRGGICSINLPIHRRRRRHITVTNSIFHVHYLHSYTILDMDFIYLHSTVDVRYKTIQQILLPHSCSQIEEGSLITKKYYFGSNDQNFGTFETHFLTGETSACVITTYWDGMLSQEYVDHFCTPQCDNYDVGEQNKCGNGCLQCNSRWFARKQRHNASVLATMAANLWFLLRFGQEGACKYFALSIFPARQLSCSQFI